MQANTDGEKPTTPLRRDPEVLSLLQDLSRRLDINSAENIHFVRDTLRELIGTGKIRPPSPTLGGEQFSAELRAITQQQGWDVCAASLRALSPAQAMLLLRKDGVNLDEPPDVASLTVPELSQIISDGIRLNSGLSPSSRDRMQGKWGSHRRS